MTTVVRYGLSNNLYVYLAYPNDRTDVFKLDKKLAVAVKKWHTTNESAWEAYHAANPFEEENIYKDLYDVDPILAY